MPFREKFALSRKKRALPIVGRIDASGQVVEVDRVFLGELGDQTQRRCVLSGGEDLFQGAMCQDALRLVGSSYAVV